MKKSLIVLASLCLAAAPALAQNANDLNPKAGRHATNPVQDHDNHGNHGNGNDPTNKATPGGSGNLIDHGGPVMNSGKVVCIFWGSIPSSYSSNMQSFRTDANGIVSHAGMLTQYGVTVSTLVGTHEDVFDPTPPLYPRVTDVGVQNEIAHMVGFNPSNTNTIYEVFIPDGYYSDDGAGDTSCGGPNLQYCAYHSHGDGLHLATNVKYSIEPWPSCSGCSTPGWTTNQNANHFMIHETREALTDPYGTTWYDSVGYEADDKCAWDDLFISVSTGFGFQREYSNATGTCVQR